MQTDFCKYLDETLTGLFTASEYASLLVISLSDLWVLFRPLEVQDYNSN